MNIKEFFTPYEIEGQSVLIQSGRPLYDLENDEQGTITTLLKQIAAYAHSRHQMAMISYSLAEGLRVPYSLYSKGDCATIKKMLSSYGIQEAQSSGSCNASQELVGILRGISKLAYSSDADSILWQDGERMKFLFLFEFSSDILATPVNDNQKTARELIYEIYYSKSFRDRGNLFVLSDVVEDKIDGQLRGLLYNKYLPYPGYEDKLSFLDALHQSYPGAKYDDGVDDQIIANLSSCTPNRGLDQLFRASQISGLPIGVAGLIERKSKDVESISEGTISILDTSRVKGVVLEGENIRVPMEYLGCVATCLRERSASIPMNIILAGAPGTGKTDLSLMVANLANVPAYGLNSAKNSLVGETERRANLQTRTLTTLTPMLACVDEITEFMPVERSRNLDSGASDAVMQSLLTFLSDNSRRGRSLLIGTTNCVGKMGAAMRDRFVIIPVIMPSVEDFPKIVCSIASKQAGVSLDPKDGRIIEAANIFYDKHLMPRRIREMLELVSMGATLTPELVLQAARDANPLDGPSWLAAVYADLGAISATVSKTLYPWYGREDTYPFPDYIRSILDENYEVDRDKLNRELNRLKPLVNV